MTEDRFIKVNLFCVGNMAMGAWAVCLLIPIGNSKGIYIDLRIAKWFRGSMVKSVGYTEGSKSNIICYAEGPRNIGKQESYAGAM
jgi:hypothetical protein